MCGWLSMYEDNDRLAERFHVDETTLDDIPPRWNVAPTQPIVTIARGARPSDQTVASGTFLISRNAVHSSRCSAPSRFREKNQNNGAPAEMRSTPLSTPNASMSFQGMSAEPFPELSRAERTSS
jgi:putative SOS response-associated peptidase YedK